MGLTKRRKRVRSPRVIGSELDAKIAKVRQGLLKSHNPIARKAGRQLRGDGKPNGAKRALLNVGRRLLQIDKLEAG
jgi:hypothetical protein